MDSNIWFGCGLTIHYHYLGKNVKPPITRGFYTIQQIVTTLSKLHFRSVETQQKNITTFMCIYVNMYFNKGLMKEIKIVSKDYTWTQPFNCEQVSIHM